MNFDPTISLGVLVQLGGFLVIVVAAYYKLSARLTKVETLMEVIFKWYEEMRQDQSRKTLRRDDHG